MNWILFALLLLTTTTASAERDVDCLAKVIHNEARGETLKGQLLVAETVMNRVDSGAFPSSICGVVNQRGQFNNKRISRKEEAYAVAELILQGELVLPSTGALYFHSGENPEWASKKKLVKKEGGHYFYK